MPSKKTLARMKRALAHEFRFLNSEGNHPAPRLISPQELDNYLHRVNFCGRSYRINTIANDYRKKFHGGKERS